MTFDFFSIVPEILNKMLQISSLTSLRFFRSRSEDFRYKNQSSMKHNKCESNGDKKCRQNLTISSF